MVKRTTVVATPESTKEFDRLLISFASRSKKLAASFYKGYKKTKLNIANNPDIGQVYEEYTEIFGVVFHVTRILVGRDFVRVFYLKDTDRCVIFWFWHTFFPESEDDMAKNLEPYVRAE